MLKAQWRDAADLNRSRAGLALALLAAAMLRFWALPQGIPFALGVDEPEVMGRAVRMMKTGDFNPHFFDYPTLYMYLQTLVAIFRFVFGAMRGSWSGLAQAPLEEFYLWGRAVTAILGTATVWVVYRAAMRWGGRTALLAAVMIAVMPLHVRESHYVLTDVPATFLVMLTLLLSLRAHERATAWSFALAGAAAGLAAAMKYNGAVAVLMPLIACAMTPAVRPSRPLTMMWIGAAMVAAFLLAAPYTFLDLPNFLNQFARLSSEYRAPSAVTTDPGWQVYLKHLRNAYKWPWAALSGVSWSGGLIVVGGLVLGLWRMATGPERLKWTLLTVFPLVYFRFISNQNIIYGRYLLPLVPFLSILAAAGVVWVVDRLRHAHIPAALRNAVIILLALTTIAPSAYTSIAYDADAAKVWTTQQAYEWITRELPAGSHICLEGSLAIKLPGSYRTSYVKQLRLHDVEMYAGSDIDYLVASSQIYGQFFEGDGPQRSPVEYADYQRIFAQTEEVARFTASDDHPGSELIILKVKR
jgi:4-amino-4-deoxy-L-arabinose transferase-like glycosyltransferase